MGTTITEYWNASSSQHHRSEDDHLLGKVWNTSNVDLLTQLLEVQRNGAAAQAKYAEELLARIAANPSDEQLDEEAHSLYDAYLNDPYLTKAQE